MHPNALLAQSAMHGGYDHHLPMSLGSHHPQLSPHYMQGNPLMLEQLLASQNQTSMLGGGMGGVGVGLGVGGGGGTGLAPPQPLNSLGAANQLAALQQQMQQSYGANYMSMGGVGGGGGGGYGAPSYPSHLGYLGQPPPPPPLQSPLPSQYGGGWSSSLAARMDPSVPIVSPSNMYRSLNQAAGNPNVAQQPLMGGPNVSSDAIRMQQYSALLTAQLQQQQQQMQQQAAAYKLTPPLYDRQLEQPPQQQQQQQGAASGQLSSDVNAGNTRADLL